MILDQITAAALGDSGCVVEAHVGKARARSVLGAPTSPADFKYRSCTFVEDGHFFRITARSDSVC